MKKEQRLAVCSYNDHGDYTIRVTKRTAQCLKCQEVGEVPAAPNWPEQDAASRLAARVNRPRGRGARVTTEEEPLAAPREWWRNVAVTTNTMPPTVRWLDAPLPEPPPFTEEELVVLENGEYPDPYDETEVPDAVLDEPPPGFEPWNEEENPR